MTDHLDDGDLGDLPSIVEEAQLTETPVFKISTSRDDMSEAALAQGFVFQPRQAPKPGQYSGISRPSLSNEAHSSDTSQHLRPAPLRSQEYADVQEPPPAEVGIQIPSNQPQFKHMSSGREQFQGQRSPSKSVITTEDEGHHRVENMLVSTSPMSHHSLLSDNIERAKRDINLVQPLERASSGFSNSSVRSYNRKSCHIADPAYGIGDLERPKPLSPARLRYGQMESIQKFRGSRGPSHSTRAREASHRPESQNSNISRKRSGVEKARAPRKRPQRNEVVEQMMQYWNRVVLITEQEKEQAVNDISDLQDHLAIQSRKFNEVSSLLKERDIEIEDVERDYKKEQERRSHLSDQNKSLAQQVQDLRQQLSDSEKQATHMSEKHTSYKERFDEMMEEQRRHYEETETQYGNLKTFMTEEGLKRFLESQRVEEALRLSIQERADMNNLFNEHQHRISQDMERSMCFPTSHISAWLTNFSENKTLQELENKIALSEMCSQREKGMLEQTIRTMMSMQLSADRSMKDIVNKFEAFTKLAPDQLTTHAKLATQLSNK